MKSKTKFVNTNFLNFNLRTILSFCDAKIGHVDGIIAYFISGSLSPLTFDASTCVLP